MTWDERSSDASLLQAWRGGDKTAADMLIARYGPRLYNFFVSKVAEGVDELCRQTFADCVDDGAPLGPDGARGSVRGLMFTAARRRLLAHLSERADRSLDPGARSVASLDSRGGEVVDGPEQQRQLMLALRQLPVDAQVALELSYWERLTVQEIARVVDASEAEVTKRLLQARGRLRGLLEQEREVMDRTVDARESEEELG